MHFDVVFKKEFLTGIKLSKEEIATIFPLVYFKQGVA
jgi:hypothetical protein